MVEAFGFLGKAASVFATSLTGKAGSVGGDKKQQDLCFKTCALRFHGIYRGCEAARLRGCCCRGQNTAEDFLLEVSYIWHTLDPTKLYFSGNCQSSLDISGTVQVSKKALSLDTYPSCHPILLFLEGVGLDFLFAKCVAQPPRLSRGQISSPLKRPRNFEAAAKLLEDDEDEIIRMDYGWGKRWSPLFSWHFQNETMHHNQFLAKKYQDG